MRTKDKVKMCPYCEGSIPMHAQECKYCGSSLAKKSTSAHAYQTEDSLASLYEPPYAPTRKSSVYGVPEQEASSASSVHDPMANHYEEEEEPNPILKSVPRPKRSPRKTATRKKKVSKEEVEEEEQTQIGSLLLLSLGGHLFTLAWLLFFFSDHGKLVLEWKSRYWFVYLLLSIPLIYKGWKKLSDE